MVMKYYFNDSWHTVNELAEMSGIAPHTLRDRLRRGYSIEQAIRPVVVNESVERFCEASWWEDWIGMPISDLHKIYWKWCIAYGYIPLSTQPFSRHLMQLNPQLKTVPIKQLGKYHRVIRLRG